MDPHRHHPLFCGLCTHFLKHRRNLRWHTPCSQFRVLSVPCWCLFLRNFLTSSFMLFHFPDYVRELAALKRLPACISFIEILFHHCDTLCGLFMSSNKRCYHFLWRLRRKILRNRTIRRVQRWWKWSRPSYLPARLRAKISDARKLEKLAKDALKSYSFPLWQWNSPYWVLQQQPRKFPPLWERMLCTSRPEILILPNWATPLVFWEVLFHGHNRTGRQIYSKENYDATRTLRDESIRKNGIPQLLFATTELKSSGDNTVIMIKIWGIGQQCNSGRE